LTTTADTPSSDCSKLPSAVPNSTAPPKSASRSRSASSLVEVGYARLTMESVAVRARTSEPVLYRR
jgi:hypothetical protein